MDGMPAHTAQNGSLNRQALSATLHCLNGCSIGEVLGMVLGIRFSLSNGATIALSIVLAFFFGYLLTIVSLIRSGVPLLKTLQLAFASDTVSIIVMEIVDNAIMLVVPGAMSAGLDQPLFWASLALSLLVAAVATFPVVRWLIARGRGHAVIHQHHFH